MLPQRLAAALGLVAALTAQGAAAQDGLAIVVVDQERLFQESMLGQSITEELEERSNLLAAENRAIEAELIAEERDLTERRPDLAPEEFRALADAFDEKVERLRAEQDAKGAEIVGLRDAERQRFSRSVGPVLLEFMRQSGAAVMFDRRSVVATADRVDVTDELIRVIDDSVGASDASPEVTSPNQVEPIGPDPGEESPAEPADPDRGEAKPD